jgi:hypothetical protein
MLENNQIWEDANYVLKVEKLGDSYHALIFKKEEDTLRFVNIVIDRDINISKLINKIGLKISNKFITLKERQHENSSSK